MSTATAATGWFAGLRRPRHKRRAVPSVMQIEAVECGAASLAMILAFYGRYVTLEELRIVCGVSRDGTKASNIIKAARRYGLVAKGFRKEVDKLHEVRWPAVLHWNFNHFVVLEGINKKGQALLNDPVGYRRVIEPDEFAESFTGVVIGFQPGPEFRPGGTKPDVLALLWDRLRRSRAAIFYIVLASVALVIPGIALPGFTRAFVDGILIGHQQEWLIPLLLGMTGVALLATAMTALQQYILIGLEAKLTVVPAAQFLWHLLRLPIDFYGQRHPGELGNRLAANERIARLLSGQLATNAFNLFSLVFYAVVMVCYDSLLAAGAILLALLNIAVFQWTSRNLAQASRQQTTTQGKLLAATVGPIRSIETIKACNLEAQAQLQWTGLQATLLSERQTIAVRSLVTSTIPALLNAFTAVFVLGVGSMRVMDGAMTIGTLIAFGGLAGSFGAPIAGLVGLAESIQAARADLERVQDVLRAEPAAAIPEAAPDDLPKPPLSGHLELLDLRYGYSLLETPLLDGFSLTLEPGMRIALVGGSGSGKSTVGRIAAGLLQPWSGTVLLDGRPAGTVAFTERARRVAYVDQDVFLFEGTIRENLTLWDETVPEVEVTQALSDACMLDEIVGRPRQIDTEVTEGGGNFSGGQRQRLEIARALVGNPSLLILDEATAALDSATEKEIDDNLRRRGCACLIIAHRLSTIRDCDEIIVLRRGQVVERGSHDALLAKGGEYAALLTTA